MERITLISGKIPVIFVAPHGASCDDVYTDQVAKSAAKHSGAYAVINNGWERSDKHDYFRDKANCNDIVHCHQDVVREEFLDPILRFKTKILKRHPKVYIIILHGMADDIIARTGDEDIRFIIGYGAGFPPSLSCKVWMKDLYTNLLKQYYGAGSVYTGKAGGAFAGWAKNNLNQLFRKWYLDEQVHSIQLEIIKKLRWNFWAAAETGEAIGLCTKELLNYSGWDRPWGWTVNEF